MIDANSRFRNSDSGTSGCGVIAIRIGKATRQTAPTASEIQATGSDQWVSWPWIAPKASPPTASAPTIEPSQSKWPLASGIARLLDVA